MNINIDFTVRQRLLVLGPFRSQTEWKSDLVLLLLVELVHAYSAARCLTFYSICALPSQRP